MCVCVGGGEDKHETKLKNTKTTTTTPIRKQNNPAHPNNNNNNKNNNPKMLKLGVTDALQVKTKPIQCSHKTATIILGKRAALINTRHTPGHYRD